MINRIVYVIMWASAALALAGSLVILFGWLPKSSWIAWASALACVVFLVLRVITTPSPEK